MAIAKPTVSYRTPDQSLKVVDTSREDVLSSVNNYAKQSETAAGAKSYMANTQVSSKSILGGITDAIGATGGGLKLDTSVLRGRLSESLGIGELTKNLGESAATDLLKAIGVADAKNVVQMAVSGKDQFDSLKTSFDFKSANGIANAINSILGDDVLKAIDPGGLLGTIKFLASSMISMGITDSIDALLAKIKDEKALNAMLEELAMEAARASEIALCRNLCGKMGSGRAYAMRNRLLTALVSNYQFATDDIRPYSQRADELLSLMGYINANWTNEGARTNTVQLEFYCKATPDCLTLFQSKPEHKFNAAIGALYSIRDYSEINQEHFPGVTW